jgi:hypothetical protein
MHECDLEAEHPVPRDGVDQLDARGGKARQRRRDVVDGIRDVMHAGPALREEAADRRVVPERREQLDAAVAEPHRRGLDSLILDALAVLEAAAEQPLVRLDRRVEVFDGDPDVMNRACLHRGDATAAYAMLAAMARRLSLVTVAVLVLAGCGGGGSKTNGEAQKTAAQVVADAQQAASAAELVHAVGAGTDNGQPLKIDLWVGHAKAKGHLEEAGAGFDVIRVGKTIYVKGSDAFLKTFAGATAVTLLHGRWIKGTTSDAQLGALAPLTDIQQLFQGVLGQHGKIENRGESDYKGQKAVEIRDTTQGGSLYVAAEGTAYPIALAGGKEQGDIGFSEWNGDVTIAAPADAVDLATLGK